MVIRPLTAADFDAVQRLLYAAASLAGKPLRIMNVNERYHGIAAFLENAGATRFVQQLEMTRSL
jgi:hypothetical protein